MSPNGHAEGFRWDLGIEGPTLRIAASDATSLRVLAGPGTGKTYALMRRVARLLQEERRDPERIFVCTFARTAARDLQKALQDLDVPGAGDVYARTLHSFCFSVLQRRSVLASTGRVPRTLLTFEKRFLVEDLSHEDDDFGRITATDERLEAFNAAWARRQTDEPGWPIDPVDRRFGHALERWLRLHECMHIGEVVPLTFKYLRDNPAAPEHTEFDTLLADEYQDLNRAEQALLDLLGDGGEMTVVGDEDQSIYSFKYAHPEGIRSYGERHPDTTDERLEDCRRCPRLVVRLARRLITENEVRAEREFREWDDNPEGDVAVVQWRNQAREAEGLATWIARRLNAGEVEPGQVLVLAQSRQLGQAIRTELTGRGIQAISFFNDKELEASPTNLDRCSAQQAFSLLTLAACPGDRVALRCWYGYGSATLYSGGWHRVVEHCEETGRSPWETLEALEAGELALPYQDTPLVRFAELKRRLAELEGLEGTDLLDAVFPPDEEWSEVFRAYAADLGEDDYDAGALYECLRTAITQPELPMDVDYVRVMSLHKSKGLSAEVVVIAGCVQGLIPRPPKERDAPTPERRREYMEEQRRMFYVGITRTRRALVLSSFTSIPRALARDMGVPVYGRHPYFGTTRASDFLDELGPDLPGAVGEEDFLR